MRRSALVSVSGHTVGETIMRRTIHRVGDANWELHELTNAIALSETQQGVHEILFEAIRSA